jgi:hypothetical protein
MRKSIVVSSVGVVNDVVRTEVNRPQMIVPCDESSGFFMPTLPSEIKKNYCPGLHH